MDPISIIAMIASAALSYGAQASAAKRQQNAAREAQQRQLQAQNRATELAAKKAEEFDPGNRQEQQNQIQQEITGQLDQQVAAPQVTAQGVQVGSTIPGGTQDYTIAKAREQAKTAASLHALAGLMGRIGSSSELRRKEATGIGDTAGAIGRVQTGAGNIAGIDQIGIQAAGQVNPIAMIASQALGSYGMGRATGAGVGKAPQYPDYGKPSGPTGAWL